VTRIAVISSSAKVYNLAVDKIGYYHRALGDEVYMGKWRPLLLSDFDKFYFSVIFTSDIPQLIGAVNHVRDWGKEVEIGGPAATFMPAYIHAHTGVWPHIGLDPRFEHVKGDYLATFTSRGCIRKCAWCGVKDVEPELVEYDKFSLAPMILDNSLLSTSWEHQELVVNKFVNYRAIDINSGFDVRVFEEKHFKLYARLNLTCWRFAFDDMKVEADVRRVAEIMRAHRLDRHHVTVYCLIGFPGTTPEECLHRLNTIIQLGLNPYPMRFCLLNSTDRKYVAPGWTEHLLSKLQTFYQTPNLWMADSWENFKPGKDHQSDPITTPKPVSKQFSHARLSCSDLKSKKGTMDGRR